MELKLDKSKTYAIALEGGGAPYVGRTYAGNGGRG